MERKWFVPLLAATVLIAGLSTPAHAAGPTRVQYDLSFTDFPIGPDWCPGYGFGVLVDAYFEITELTFPDRQRARWMLRYAAYKNDSDPTRILTFTGMGPENDWIDLTSGQVVVTGGTIHLTVPGYGLLLLSAGRLVFDGEGNVTWDAGKHDFHNGNPEGFDALCQYLAGP